MQRHALTLALPAGVGCQRGHRDDRLLKNTRHIDTAVHHGEAGLAGPLVKVEIHIEPLEARRGSHCGNFQLADPAASGIGLRRVQRSLPTGLQLVDPAFGRKRLQALTKAGIQRQAAGNLSQRRQVQLLGLELTALGLPTVRLLHA